MKISSAAITVAAFSLLSTTHAAPLAIKDGEVTGRLHYRRGSDLSDASSLSSASADAAIEDLDIGFEPGASLLLPRILKFFKRQSSSAAAISTSASRSSAESTDNAAKSGTSDTDLTTTLMSPDYELYGFASEDGADSELTPLKAVKGK